MHRSHWLGWAIVSVLATPAWAGAQDPAAPAATPAAETPPAEAPPAEDASGTAAPAAEPAPSSLEAEQAAAEAGQTPDPSDPEHSGRIGDEQVLYEESTGVEEQRSGTSPHEDPDRSYFFLGGFYRHTFIPAGILELFVEKAFSVNNPQFGFDFTYRRDGLDIIASLWYADYTAYGPFLGPGDTADEIEIIDSNLKAFMGGVTFLWSTHFSDWFAIQYGLGFGVGGVIGDLIRTEAYPALAGPDRVSGYAPCVTPSAPMTPGSAQPNTGYDGSGGQPVEFFCGAPMSPTEVTDRDGQKGEHYNIKARNWFQGGSVPGLWFRAAIPHLALRFKPIKQLVFRIDGGFDIFSGFFVGAAASIGLN